ncbi:hypothetical protein BC830DRAFT_1098982 [Chytriomyces sp. MP71]|nr:hypothetical protein BC830DRAFT_1098982 [Chytriomyces sp. MP71]
MNDEPDMVPDISLPTITPRRTFETFHGFVTEASNAVLLMEACIQDKLKAHKMVPADAQIRSGSVVVFAETNGVVRWRDGESWSPS